MIIQEQDSSIKNLEKKLEELRVVNDEMKANFLDQLKNEKNGKTTFTFIVCICLCCKKI